MEKIYKILVFVSVVILFVNTQKGYSQVLISNTTGSPNSNAMLEIESSNKGVLIPRISSANRKLLTATPGLLVFDSDLGSFFLYGKTADGNDGWIDLSSDAGIWTRTNNNVYLSNTAYNVGIGTSTPKNRLVIQANNDSDTLLEIRDKNGVPLMVVTPVLTRFNFVKSKKGVSGGFAVGRYATAKDGKALTDTASLFLVTSDSTRVYTAEKEGKGVSGGFAVGRYATAKGAPYVKKYFFTNIDSTRVYTGGGSAVTSGGFAVGRYATAKGFPNVEKYFFTDIDSTRVYTGGGSAVTSGGFAVGRYATAKGAPYVKKYFFTDIDSTRVYSQVTAKGISGGFAVEHYATGVGSLKKFFFSNADSTTINVEDSLAGFNVVNVGSGKEEKFMKVNTENTRIGREAGNATTPGSGDVGKYNSFIGYRAGYTNVTGKRNVCIGQFAGFTNKSDYNVFIGDQTGYSNDNGRYNLFMGYASGYKNVKGDGNLFLGYQSGHENSEGHRNVFIGYNCGYNHTSGNDNLFLGNQAGQWDMTGGNNIFIGNQAGQGNFGGTNNVYIGYQAGRNISGGTGNVFIGNQAGYSGTRSNELIIDNTNTATPLIWGDFTADSLVINGDLTYTGVLTSASDLRLKTNLIPLTNVLLNLEKIRGVYYNWKPEVQNIPGRDNRRQIGVIAQELEKVYPELVYTNKKGYKTVDYTKLSAILIEAVKELQIQIIKHQNDVDKLKEENKSLKKQQKFILQEIQTIKNTNKTK